VEFYGHFNSGLGGFFSFAMDLRAFLGELVCFAPYWGKGNSLQSILLISPVADLSSSGCRKADLQLSLRIQECRFTTPFQDVGMQI
jgi:hypothetical protein